MKKDGGFISIFILIVFTLMISIIVYLIYIVSLETSILSCSKNNVQSFYNSEAKILMCTEDKYFEEQLIPNLLGLFRKTNFVPKPITIDQIDLEDGDINSKIELKLKDIDDRRCLFLKSESIVNKTKTEVKSILTLVNSLFESKNPTLDVYNSKVEDIEPLKSLLLNIESNISVKDSNIYDNMYGFETEDYDIINLTPDKLICKRNTMESSYIEAVNKKEVFIIGKKHNGESIELSISKPGMQNKIILYGVIYIEGDIIVSTELQFNGIMIINGGELDISEGVNLNGMIIYINNEDVVNNPDLLDLKYNSKWIYKYGTYIPGFLDVKIDLIKSN